MQAFFSGAIVMFAKHPASSDTDGTRDYQQRAVDGALTSLGVSAAAAADEEELELWRATLRARRTCVPGDGLRLFEGVDARRVTIEIAGATPRRR